MHIILIYLFCLLEWTLLLKICSYLVSFLLLLLYLNYIFFLPFTITCIFYPTALSYNYFITSPTFIYYVLLNFFISYVKCLYLDIWLIKNVISAMLNTPIIVPKSIVLDSLVFIYFYNIIILISNLSNNHFHSILPSV